MAGGYRNGAGVPFSPQDVVAAGRLGFTDKLRATFNVWMGAGAPPIAQAPADERPRIFDYIPGFNAFRSPDNVKQQDSGGVSFPQLRLLGGQTVVNGAIYHAAEKIKKIEFTYVCLPKEGEPPQQTQERSGKDPRITELRTFFESPDKDQDYPEWISDAWVQILTCDNLSLLRWDYEYGGSKRGPYAINVIDGDHIQPVIDDTGRVPIGLDEVAYEQWTRGVPRKEFTRRQLMYRMCWPSAQKVMGCSPVERMWFYLNIALRRDMTKLGWYTEGNIPAGIWPVSTQHWGPKDISQAQDLLDLLTSGQGAKSKLLLLPSGDGNPVFPAEKSLIDPFDEYLIRMACYFIGVPHSALVKEQNKATSENARDNADEEGELPRIDFTRRLHNRIVRQWFGYEDIVALPSRDVELNAGLQSEINERGIKSGLRQLDEVRKENGDAPLGLPPGHFLADGSFITFEAELASIAKAAAAPVTPAPDAPQAPSDDVQPDAIVDTSKMDGPFKYASLQVNIIGSVAQQLLDMAASIPDDALAEKGREADPHVTLKFGIEPKVTVDEIRGVLGKDVTGTIKFGPTAFFATKDYDVVFVTVESEDLKGLNSLITEGVDTIETQANYVPHATLAYVESGRGHEFAGMGTLNGVEYPYSAVWYSDVDGKLTKLQTVRSHVRAKAQA